MSIVRDFPISTKEYEQLEKKFGKLCHKQAWVLIKNNVHNNCADDREDILQEIRIALVTAGSYYKRQTYIESCFTALENVDGFVKMIVDELKNLWKNRTKHGASKQKFGPYQETILETLVKQLPLPQQPQKNLPLIMDSRFATYCKNVTWNRQKNLGKKITKEKSIRVGLCSLSENDFLI